MSKHPPVVLRAGFRFFFLAAGLFAVFAMAAWMLWIGIHAAGAGIRNPTINAAPHFWHGHEMIFGYACAVIAGFFLTAVPSWTGEPAAQSRFVATAGGLWLAGRAAIWFSAWIDPILVAVVDLALLPTLSWRIGINLVKRPKPQNVALLGLLALMITGNLLVHLEWVGLTDDTAERGLWLGLFAVTALVTVIGGRVTPAFTRNVLMRSRGPEWAPENRAIADRAGIVSAVLLGPLYGLGVPDILLGLVALIAAVANGVRFSGWRWRATLNEPILWVLHLGFAMLVFGYALLALAWLGSLLHPVAAMHGLAIGAVGTMTMAMMTRASLGHSGRALRVSKPIAAAYLMIPAATAVRVFGPALLPSLYNEVMLLSGALWVGAFAIYLVVYWPVLAFESPMAGQA